MIKQKKKICKGCGEEKYIFSKGKCKFCDLKSKKVKTKKLDFRTENLEELNTSQLKRIADYELRQFLIRKNNAFVSYKCPLKNKVYTISQIEVAHYIDRKHMCTRYDLNNCHLVSKQSNTWDAQIPKEGYKSLHHYEYEKYLGKEKTKKLLEKSKDSCIFAKEDYIQVINNFRNA